MLKIKEELCKRTWKNLVDHFRTVYYDVLIRQKNEGISLEESMSSVRWTYFTSMIFLKDSIQRRLSFAELKDFDEEAEMKNNPVSRTEIRYEQDSFTCEENDVFRRSSSLDYDDGIEAEEEEEEEEEDEMDVKPDLATIIQQQEEMNVGLGVGGGGSKRKHCEDDDDRVEFSEIMSQENGNRDNDATEDKFCHYLLELLHQVPNHLRRRCRNVILDVTNTFADGNIPIILKRESD